MTVSLLRVILYIKLLAKVEEKRSMITGELKNKIDGSWEIFWTGGLINPLDVIEQMTYMMFIRDLGSGIV